MDGLSAASGSVVKGKYILDAGFLETRREQCECSLLPMRGT